MIGRKLLGLLGTLVVVAMVAAGAVAFVTTYGLEASAGDLLVPTLVTLFVVAAAVFGLFVLGARSDSWIRSPYW
ncbi:hypothetical protein ACFOZ7_04120 [Natribaculum luteum]|uniref:Major facilitator superfamily (MFS) profile domain-containing protein n=1 Tax=Natribaculum luteum TaxID=1586232 RepID=A0ABD5NWL7_9EURY|nr:hypothetical protein [Natribaculum luteum]